MQSREGKKLNLPPTYIDRLAALPFGKLLESKLAFHILTILLLAKPKHN